MYNKIQFSVFNIKNIIEKYRALNYVEETVKTRQLVKEKELHQEEA